MDLSSPFFNFLIIFDLIFLKFVTISGIILEVKNFIFA